MDTDTVWRHIDHERSMLADLLESLPEEAWRTSSMCEGWTVRDVAAHLTFSHARLRDIVGPAVRTGLRYNAMIAYAATHSPLARDEIITTLRGFVGSRRKAPFVTDLEPLLDILVHGQDICVPLGIDRSMPVDAAVAAADRVLALRGMMRLWDPPSGVRLVATDADWSYGEGRVIEASIRDHLLALTGRTAATARSVG